MQDTIKNYLSKHGFERFEPKVVLFDMDGVLYNSMPNHAKAWQQAMAQFGIIMTAHDAYATEGARGIDTIRMMVRQQQGRDISLQEAQAMYDVKTRLFHEMPAARVFYGVRPLMQKIIDDGMTIGIVTGSGQRPLIERLEKDFRLFLDPKHIVTAYDVERGKPYPDPYLIGMQKAGFAQPWETIVVENAPLGVRAARAAGCFTIAVNSGPLPDQQLLDEGADLLFASINDLRHTWEHHLATDDNAGHKYNDAWNTNYQRVKNFLEVNHRRPSKYYEEDAQMNNWLKYNKKLMNQGRMPRERAEKFALLLELLSKYRRINQFSYLNADSVNHDQKDSENHDEKNTENHE